MSKKKTRHMSQEEQKRVDFILSFPDVEIISVGEGPQDKTSPFYEKWKEQNGKK